MGVVNDNNALQTVIMGYGPESTPKHRFFVSLAGTRKSATFTMTENVTKVVVSPLYTTTPNSDPGIFAICFNAASDSDANTYLTLPGSDVTAGSPTFNAFFIKAGADPVEFQFGDKVTRVDMIRVDGADTINVHIVGV
jgi:hypothetical protein